MAGDSGIVIDQGKWEWSEMWKKEDWWAIWIGFFLLIAAMVIYFPHSGEMKEVINKAEAKYGQDAQRTHCTSRGDSSASKSTSKSGPPSLRWMRGGITPGWSSGPKCTGRRCKPPSKHRRMPGKSSAWRKTGSQQRDAKRHPGSHYPPSGWAWSSRQCPRLVKVRGTTSL